MTAKNILHLECKIRKCAAKSSGSEHFIRANIEKGLWTNACALYKSSIKGAVHLHDRLLLGRVWKP